MGSVGNGASNVAVVLGASRGVGLALCQRLTDGRYTVFAAVRNSNDQLEALAKAGNFHVISGVDIADDKAAQPVLQALDGRQIDLLIVAAGIQQLDTVDTVTKDGIRQQFEVNALGPLFTVLALRPSLSQHAKVALLSSRNASITDVDFTGGELYGYRMSKVALNMAGATLARDLKPAGIPVVLVHPGVVNTEMLRSLRSARGVPPENLTANTLAPDDSAARIVGLLAGLELSETGKFWNAATGEVLGW